MGLMGAVLEHLELRSGDALMQGFGHGGRCLVIPPTGNECGQANLSQPRRAIPVAQAPSNVKIAWPVHRAVDIMSSKLHGSLVGVGPGIDAAVVPAIVLSDRL